MKERAQENGSRAYAIALRRELYCARLKLQNAQIETTENGGGYTYGRGGYLKAQAKEGVCLAVEDNDSGLKVSDSDSDSGQGSCGMGSPTDHQKSLDFLENRDSDDEILIRKKSKHKKIFEESDSEDDDDTNAVTSDTKLNIETVEENEENEATERIKPRRIRSALVDSDDSDCDGILVASDEQNDVGAATDKGSPKKNSRQNNYKSSKKQTGVDMKEKGKSKRKAEKERKKMASIEKLKKDKKQMSSVSNKTQREENQPSLNDSGCLLADGDLFDKDEESDNCEEESLDIIRANMKSKLKSRSSHIFDGAEDEEVFEERLESSEKKERKAARLSKEAIKQLHSETQRLLRESAVSLPYHLPQPKTIHDFFKRRSRPVCQGNAMQLIKSSKYHLLNAEDETESESKQTEPAGCDSEVPLLNPQAVALEGAVTNASAEGESQSLDILENEQIVNYSEKSTLLSDTNGSHQPLANQETEECIQVDTFKMVQNVSEPDLKSTTCDPTESTEDGITNIPVVQEKPKLSKLEKLRALGISLSIKPRLCPDDGSFINLDEPKPNKDLEALKERFLKHSLHKAKIVTEKKINLNIVRKETTADGKEELKADVVPVTVDVENLEENVHGKPGEKLQVLKAKLQEAMKQRRLEERQKRQALYDLDNENGYEDEEDAEEEMTDESEEEDENQRNEEGNVETLENLLGEDGNEDEPTDEALEESGITKVTISVPRPVTTESTLMLFKDTSTKIGGDSISDKMELDEECKGNDKLEEDDFLSPMTKDSSHNSSFELIGSMIPSYQPLNKNGRNSLLPGVGGFRSPSPVTFKANFHSSASKSSGKMSEPSLPVEDSQDLYNASPEPKASFACAGVDSQFQFSLEDDTQSQLLDADGFLNVGHNRSKYSSVKQRLVLDTMDENAMDANMGELLDLCSGNFRGSLSDSSQQDEDLSKKDAMDELLGLCSGKFMSQADSLPQDSSALIKEDRLSEAAVASLPLERENNDDEEEEEFGDFQLLPCDESGSEKVNEEESEEDDDERENEDLDDEEEEILRKGKKRKLRLQDFMEDEAELSGSDIGSGDEDEGEEDEYEEEAIDEELPSDEELQDQVNKIHMKVTMDEDKRRLRLYQERYLADGDLHSDGPGRMRKFRWKNIDDASQMDMFNRYSEVEDQEGENEEMDEAEVKRRKERFEREQWLREQSEKGNTEEEEIGENSQFMKLAKKVTEKVLQRRSTLETTEAKKQGSKNPFEMQRPFSLPNMKNGSLLEKSGDFLQKLSTIPALNPNAPRNTRNFVFHTLSPQKKEQGEKPKPKVRKNISAATPSPKRLKSDQSNTATGKYRSIFPFLEN
ncbi:claspin [Leptodactylus fuscus]